MPWNDYAFALDREARIVKENSYSPYSHFKVGAALLAQNEQGEQKVFAGTNMESANYDVICAERAALSHAITHGYTTMVAIAIIGDTEEGPTPPCGRCRQALAEFNLDLPIMLLEPVGFKMTNLRDILPMAFTPENLK